MGVEVRAVEGDDTGCFLPAMLQGMQPKGCQHIRLIASEYAEDAALMEAVKLLGSSRQAPSPSAIGMSGHSLQK